MNTRHHVDVDVYLCTLIAPKPNKQGIEVILQLDWFAGHLPTAGDPFPGIVGYGVGASFIMVSFMQQPRRGVQVAIWVVVALAIIGSVVILFNNRGQLDGKGDRKVQLFPVGEAALFVATRHVASRSFANCAVSCGNPNYRAEPESMPKISRLHPTTPDRNLHSQ